METAKELKQEVVLVAGYCPHGSHEEVAKKAKISISYSVRLRRKDFEPIDSEENRSIYKKMLKHYRRKLKNHSKKLQEVLQETI
tara:strand:- start:153 stop:404 length:252 start_codon:yes stop_codon:yes gene_type:complete